MDISTPSLESDIVPIGIFLVLYDGDKDLIQKLHKQILEKENKPIPKDDSECEEDEENYERELSD